MSIRYAIHMSTRYGILYIIYYTYAYTVCATSVQLFTQKYNTFAVQTFKVFIVLGETYAARKYNTFAVYRLLEARHERPLGPGERQEAGP